jgi:predicted adenine nucleotide alpha hydrolase (AANH) superfamily ATPase
MKLLLHTCCAPCLLGTLPSVKDFETSCFWFNPNIHPYAEYKSRLNALENFAQADNINLIIKDYYGLREFTGNVINNLDNKCGFCYDWRIKECAEYAAENHFDAFSASLLVSPYQNHEKIKETGEKYADLYNIKFYYGDFRGNFRDGQKKARENNIYMQKYCGCIFSEEERYLKK